ncbi:MAG: phytanoyl-CoA dioxygenase family protein [Chloroflexi bacterium]|nr:phytanoyl-CoA dioxygenase family protein [Chloroflexota bacterium]
MVTLERPETGIGVARVQKLDAAALERWREEGYLVVEGVLDVERDITPVVREYERLLDELCRTWHAQGKLASPYADLPFGKRLSRALGETGEKYERYIDFALPQSGIREDTPIHLGPAVFHMLTSPRLLDAVERLIGPEIVCNPIHHTRIKVPQREVPEERWNSHTAATDWHQDQGVALPEQDESNVLTVWLPVTEATVENGCLIVLPRSHTGELAHHCLVSPAKKGLHIPDKYLAPEQPVALPMKPGDLLFMHRRTMHASLANESGDIRWSMDLRYNPIGEPTGRPAFPAFVARSKAHPERVLRDPGKWAQLWLDTRKKLAGVPSDQWSPFNRWSKDSELCA